MINVNIRIKDHEILISIIVGMIVVLASLLYLLNQPYQYGEIDSYVLPIESIEKNASLIITKESIDFARQDFPDLYEDVTEYKDLRNSKLIKIDSDHWYSYYFPAYALVCIPVKLVLRATGIDTIYLFKVVHSVWLSIAVAMSIYYGLKSNKRYLGMAVLLLVGPIWLYMNYVGVEPIIYSFLAIAILCWKEKKYKTAAFFISFISTVNPTIMGIGGWLFVDYLIEKKIVRELLYNKKIKWNEIIGMCVCYIPALISVIANLLIIGRFFPTVSKKAFSIMNQRDKLYERLLAYVFDLNLGLASISILLAILFVCGGIYAICRRDRKQFNIFMGIITTMTGYSMMFHINCGMINCARYIMWTYPLIIFFVVQFLNDILKNIRVYISILAICMASIILTFVINEGEYSYIQFNNISKMILDNCPQLYVSFCESTFYSRTHNVDGGYIFDKFSVYQDSKTGEVRKILYYNSEENLDALKAILVSDTDYELYELNKKFEENNENKTYYISISPKQECQYRLNPNYAESIYNWLEKYKYRYEWDADMLMHLTAGVVRQDCEVYDELYDVMYDPQKTDEQFVNMMYKKIFGREVSKEQLDTWVRMLKEGLDRKDMFASLISSEYFFYTMGVSQIQDDTKMDLPTYINEYLWIKAYAKSEGKTLKAGETIREMEEIIEDNRHMISYGEFLAIYDNETGYLTDIIYKNNDKTIRLLNKIIVTEEKNEELSFASTSQYERKEFKIHNGEKYIVDKKFNPELLSWLQSVDKAEEWDMNKLLELSGGLMIGKTQAIDELYDAIFNDDLSDVEFVENLYAYILDREGTDMEINCGIMILDNKEMNRKELFENFIYSEEFKYKNSIEL